MYKTAVFLLVMLVFHASAFSSQVLHQTKDKLAHLVQKIFQLKQHLSHSETRHNQLEQVLANQDKKIGQVVQQQHQITNKLQIQQAEMKHFLQQDQQLSRQLKEYQMALANSVRARYFLGKELAMQGLLKSHSPEQLNRWLVFCQYFISSERNLIDHVRTLQKALSDSHDRLQVQITEQTHLQTELKQKQAQLQREKMNQSTVMDQIQHTIQSEQQKLSNYNRDKDNLAQVLQRLQKEQVSSYSTKSVPLVLTNGKFMPLSHAASIQRWNQGLLYQAVEGTPVKAVRSGKVVFSDWLRGYGLLLIIDHGHGLMTLYAYNQALFKHQGERVVAGQQIATVGHSGGRRNDGLYFEVRRFGKVVSA